MKYCVFIIFCLLFSHKIFSKKYTFAVIDASPYVIVEGHDLSGSIVDNFNECVAPKMKKLGHEVELKDYPFKRAITFLDKGLIEGFYLFIPERSQKYSYSKKTVFSLQPSICSDNLEKALKARKNKFKGIRYSHFRGEHPAPELFGSLATPVKISSDRFVYQSFRMIKGNRIDLMYHPLQAAVEYEKKQHDGLYDDIKCIYLSKKKIPLKVAFRQESKIYKVMNEVLNSCL